jgi:flavoprotein hydroxylase
MHLSVWLGNLICETDHAAAARRDAAMARPAASGADGGPDMPDCLADGLLHREPDGARAAHAGTLLPQARVTSDGRARWFDEAAGPGFVLLARDDPAALLDPGSRAFLAGLGTRFVYLRPAGAGRDVADTERVYLPWLDSMGALAALVRPDFYLFGAGRDRAGVAAMVAGLRARLEPESAGSKGDRHDLSPAIG